MKIKRLYNEYKKAAEITNQIEERWIADEESEELEAAFDAAYQVEFNAMMEVINEIRTLTGIDQKTARSLMMSDRFEDLIRRIA